MEKIKNYVNARSLKIMLIGCVTGIFAGLCVTLYNIAAKFSEDCSKDIYSYIRAYPAFIPLLVVVLLVGAFFISVLMKLVPMIRGSGIPQTEGASRGILKYNWWKVMVSVAAGSLATIFMGLTAGSEGPSVQIGGCSGMGVSKLFRQNDVERRYQITGGACAGLAVAFNAPFTGMAFAFEEAHKRFTPEIVICSLSSIITGLITSSLLKSAFGLQITSAFTSFVMVQMPVQTIWYSLIAAAIASLTGMLFYKLVIVSKAEFKKIRFLKGYGLIAIVILIGGIFALVTEDVMGGGGELIDKIGTLGGQREMAIERIFSSPVIVSLIIIVVLKLVSCIINMGSGIPCGMFVPMLAIGACLGAISSKLCSLIGMDYIYSDIIVMVSMATFFTTVVRAPVTAIIMTVELTWSFAGLLPVVIGVMCGYMISEVFNVEPIYEKLLVEVVEEHKKTLKLSHYVAEFTIECGSLIENNVIRDVLWPNNSLVSMLKRGEETLVPDGKTKVLAGDIITVSFECENYDDYIRSFNYICKNQNKK